MSSWSSLFKSDDDQTRPDNFGGSIIKEAFSQHLRGVAAFLAPPSHQHHENTDTSTSSPTISGIKNDLAEIEESFKSSLSLLSTKLTSSFLPFSKNNHNYKDDDTEEDAEEYDDDEEEVAGINEEVVNFVRELSSQRECWTDFPLNLSIDYDMSDCQREHCATIEDLVPSLVTFRQKHCSHLSDGQFWMIYYTILLPRLNENDQKHLSTPEIVEVRETLAQKLQNETLNHSEAINLDGKQKDRSLFQQKKVSGTSLDEDLGPSTSLDAHGQAQNEEDVSFSDLEDDDEEKDLSRFRRQSNTMASHGESNEWIQLTEKSGAKPRRGKPGQSAGLQGKDSEGESSSDWHHVNDVDCESLNSD